MGDAVDVLPVPLEDVPAAEAKQPGQHLLLAYRDGTCLRHLGEQVIDRITGDQLRQEEIDGQRHPGGQQIEPQLAEHVALPDVLGRSGAGCHGHFAGTSRAAIHPMSG